MVKVLSSLKVDKLDTGRVFAPCVLQRKEAGKWVDVRTLDAGDEVPAEALESPKSWRVMSMVEYEPVTAEALRDADEATLAKVAEQANRERARMAQASFRAAVSTDPAKPKRERSGSKLNAIRSKLGGRKMSREVFEMLKDANAKLAQKVLEAGLVED